MDTLIISFIKVTSNKTSPRSAARLPVKISVKTQSEKKSSNGVEAITYLGY